MIVTPAPRRSRSGNRVTALRWARLLRQLGHRVTVTEAWRGSPCDVLVALHARRSHPSIAAFRRAYPGRPLVVALTGTDLYRDLGRSPAARRSLVLATRIVTLQPAALAALPASVRPKAKAILQSATAPRRTAPRARSRTFDVCVVGHLRPVKDPMRTAMAARRLPAASRLRVIHVGGALDNRLAGRARREEIANHRYRWRGELPRAKTLRVLARSHLLVVSSRLEGGANVVSEALACAVPVVSSRIDGSVGILGPNHPGYFPVGDTAALARLLQKAETDRRFYARLRACTRRLAPRVHPRRERAAWESLLAGLDRNR